MSRREQVIEEIREALADKEIPPNTPNVLRRALEELEDGRNPNAYERLLDDCSYEIVQAFTNGKGVRLAMTAVFARMNHYFTVTLGYEKPAVKPTTKKVIRHLSCGCRSEDGVPKHRPECVFDSNFGRVAKCSCPRGLGGVRHESGCPLGNTP